MALAFQPAVATAAPAANEIVWGENLPKALDPHVVYDVPMQFYMLNVYDTLYFGIELVTGFLQTRDPFLIGFDVFLNQGNGRRRWVVSRL